MTDAFVISCPGEEGVRVRDGIGAALSRAITVAERGRLDDASYYVRDGDGVVRARVDRQNGVTLIHGSGLDREAGERDGGMRPSVASSTRRPGSARPQPKEEHEVAETKRTTTKRRSSGRSSARAAAPAKEKAKDTTTTPEAEAAPVVEGSTLYDALLEQVRQTVEGVEEKPNASGTYTRLLKAGKAFAYIFPPRKGGVALKIPKQLLGVAADLPSGHGFKTTGWGLTRTVTDPADAEPVAKALAVAAKAVEQA